MIEPRPFESLYNANHGWLNARHHFSFADYHDQNRMGWGSIRVWNDDEIAPGAGFPPHPHADMEIITYVREGAISHQDSLGNSGRTAAGDVQVMSAGTGIRHAEYNAEDVKTTLFQIWVFPDARGHTPRWGTKPFPKAERAGTFVPLASGFEKDVADGALLVHTPARLLGATLLKGQSETYAPEKDRYVYLVLAAGRARINGLEFKARDGAAITDEDKITIEALEDTEILLLDAY